MAEKQISEYERRAQLRETKQAEKARGAKQQTKRQSSGTARKSRTK